MLTVDRPKKTTFEPTLTKGGTGPGGQQREEGFRKHEGGDTSGVFPEGSHTAEADRAQDSRGEKNRK